MDSTGRRAVSYTHLDVYKRQHQRSELNAYASQIEPALLIADRQHALFSGDDFLNTFVAEHSSICLLYTSLLISFILPQKWTSAAVVTPPEPVQWQELEKTFTKLRVCLLYTSRCV